MRPTRFIPGVLAAAALLSLAACGGGSDSSEVTLNLTNDRGTIQRNPPTQLASLTAAQFSAQLRASSSGQQLLQLAGLNPADANANLPCGIDLRYIQYGTVGGAGEKTNATGALMIPTGGAACTGAKPIVLHAHGTTTAKDYNIALLGSTNAAGGEAGLIAALYAAQGMIVVAPNYAGYEASALSYHPYLNADQQSKDMIDALSAGRQALAKIANGTSDNGKLLITGYSQGGHVAMATAKALRLAGQPVTAVAGGSGPYALAKFADAIFGGNPIVGGTLFAPLLTTSWKRSYGDIYNTASDVYNTAYATGIETLMPSTLTTTQLFTTGKVPQAALFDNTANAYPLATAQFQPLYSTTTGLGLINNTYANAVLADAAANPCTAAAPTACVTGHPLRARAKQNDLRGGWAPAFPVFMCGGANDPTVFYANTQLQAAWFGTLPLPTGTVTTLDLETASGGGADPFAAAKVGFQTAIAAINTAGGATAVAQNYHATVAPFCTASTAGFFRTVLATAP
ncbi:alpha/beta hydrolase family protein [Leptothrix sp. BB-4]